MTREERNDAIEFFKKVAEKEVDGARYSRLAIEALEQQDKVSDAIKEIRDLFKQPAAYVPNYDAYGLCLGIIYKHMEVEG